MKLKLPFGHKNGSIVHVSKVERGLACGCTCPGCGHSLVARKGNKVTPHFAHYKGQECENALESAMHLASKEVLMREEKIVLPQLIYLSQVLKKIGLYKKK